MQLKHEIEKGFSGAKMDFDNKLIREKVNLECAKFKQANLSVHNQYKITGTNDEKEIFRD